MRRSLTFKLRINPEERLLLAVVASHLDRTQGDTVRFLIKAAAQDMKIGLENLPLSNNRNKGENNG